MSDNQKLRAISALEAEVLTAETRQRLIYIALNRSRQLMTFGHILWLRRQGKRWRVQAISSQPVWDNNSVFAQWLQARLDVFSRTGQLSTASVLEILSNDKTDFDYPFPYGFFAPFSGQDKVGGLLFTRTQPFDKSQQQLLMRFVLLVGHVWAGLGQKKRFWQGWHRPYSWGAVGLLLLLSFLPVPMSVLAPAEIVARDPYIVSAPIDGVVAHIEVTPNQVVREGMLLARLDDIGYVNEYQLAREDESLSEARLRQAALGAFIDDQARREVAVAQAEQALAYARQTYAQARLEQTELRSPRDGMAIYSDPQDWMGRPVTTGEAIFQIADPKQIMVRLEVPLNAGSLLQAGTRIRLYMDSDPLKPLDASLDHASYYAQEQAGGHLAYTAYGYLDNETRFPRIGTRGVAKVYGQKVSLGFWLLRHPLVSVRQFTGL